MNYKSFNLGDWIGHISGVIEDETTLDGNEMRDLVEFLSTLKQEPVLDKIRAEIETKYGHCNLCEYGSEYDRVYTDIGDIADILQIIDKYKTESEKA